MKKTLLTFILGSFLLSCNNNARKTDEGASAQDSIVTKEVKEEATQAPETTSSFDINSIPVSDQEIGDFPFFSFPKGMKSQNRPIERDYDIIYFPIDGIMTPIEGKVFKVNVSLEDRRNDNWSLPFFLKSYDDAILSAGGQKIFDGKIAREEYERYKDEATYLGEDGSIGYTSDNIKVYVIRRSDGKNIYMQLTGNTAGGKLNILQEEGFRQTITILKSDQIQKDLNEKGKAVLYINFDTDKATLKPDGLEAVREIVKVLTSDPYLKIAINGYTDNSGSKEHNLKLSEDRASAVKNEITKAGIAAERLTSKGFGQEKPIADNGTEEGKAQNRRVELVKI